MKAWYRFSGFLLMIITCYTLPAQSRNILIVGDSLSASYNIPLEQGWVELLKQRVAEQAADFNVINASISGETTQNALLRLPDLLQRHAPEIVVIELGGNDGLRGFSLPSIKQNLSAMIQKAQAQGATVVLTGIHIPPNYGPAYTKVFYQAYLDLSKQYNTLFVPFILEGVGDNPELMQADGVHPKASAQPIVLDNMWPTIKTAIEQVKQNSALPADKKNAL
ncbi:MAG: arylesterase [Gammaproteobacteria bacterium]|nr:arylesterase [Gammaproteobacteria bacterium]